MKAVFNDKPQLATLGGADQHEGSHEGASEFAAALGKLAQEENAAQRPTSKSALALLLGGAPLAAAKSETANAPLLPNGLSLLQSAGDPDGAALAQDSTRGGALAALAGAFGGGAACQPGAEHGTPSTALLTCAGPATALVAGEAGLCVPAHAAADDADAPDVLGVTLPTLGELGPSAIVLAEVATCALPAVPVQHSLSAPPGESAGAGADAHVSAAALERFADSAVAQVGGDPLDYLPVPVRIENLCVEAAPADPSAKGVELPSPLPVPAADAALVVRETVPHASAPAQQPAAAASTDAQPAPSTPAAQAGLQAGTSAEASAIVEARPLTETSQRGTAQPAPSALAAPVGSGPDASLAAAKADAPQAAEPSAATATARAPSSETVLGSTAGTAEHARDAAAPRSTTASAAAPAPKTAAAASAPLTGASGVRPSHDAQQGWTSPGVGASAAGTSWTSGAGTASASMPAGAPATPAEEAAPQAGALPTAATNAGAASIAGGALPASGQASVAQPASSQAQPAVGPAPTAVAASPLADAPAIADAQARPASAQATTSRLEAPRAARPTAEAGRGPSAPNHPFGMRSVDAAVAGVIEAARILHGASAAAGAAAASASAVADRTAMVFELPSTELTSSAQDTANTNAPSDEAPSATGDSMEAPLASELAGQFGGMTQQGSGGGNMAGQGDNTSAPPEAPLPLPSDVQDAADAIWLRGQGPKAAAVSVQHPELGTMNLVVQQEAGRVDVRAVLETPKAAVILRAQESAIKYGLQQAGMTLSSLRVKTREETETPRARELARKRRTDGWEA